MLELFADRKALVVIFLNVSASLKVTCTRNTSFIGRPTKCFFLKLYVVLTRKLVSVKLHSMLLALILHKRQLKILTYPPVYRSRHSWPFFIWVVSKCLSTLCQKKTNFLLLSFWNLPWHLQKVAITVTLKESVMFTATFWKLF